MSMDRTDRLYQLLPAIYRVRDASQGEPLRALLRVIGTEVDRIEDDISGLYDNWFIETCAEWVVPYIGDLLAVRPIRSVPSARVSTRAYVANTLAYRRRKGTALVLEQLARDTTGWPAKAVEFFQRLAITQYTNHVRHVPQTVPDIRNAALTELAGTAFDVFAHVPEVRRIATRGGKYNVPNVGIFLWRLQSYPIGERQAGIEATDFGTARRVASVSGDYFTFHPVGVDTPLFNSAVAERSIEHLAQEENVPGRLRRLALQSELEAIRRHVASGSPADDSSLKSLQFMGSAAPSFRIFVESAGPGSLVEIPREDIYICSIPSDVETASPPRLAAAVDPERGRLRVSSAFNPSRVLVSFNYGFPGDVGGGPYDRTESISSANRAIASAAEGVFAPHWQAGVSHLGESGSSSEPIFPDLAAAIAAWNALPAGQTGVIVMMDSLTEESAFAGASPPAALEILVKEGSRLLITSGVWPKEPDGTRRRGTFEAVGVRAHFIGDVSVRGLAPPASAAAGGLFIDGLLLEGSLHVASGNLGTLGVQHCTVVPGAGRITVNQDNDRLQLRLTRSISGSIDIAVPIAALEVRDCLVEATSGSPLSAVTSNGTACTFESSTFAGHVTAETLSASNCIFTQPVQVVRRQSGCVRFSYVPPESTTPRRYRCQPDFAVESAIEAARTEADSSGTELSQAAIDNIRQGVQARVKPLFTSMRYGDPAYGQLDLRCPGEIRTGAEEGSEMGVWRFLQQPDREANLRTVLQEYVRFGLEAGVFFVS